VLLTVAKPAEISIAAPMEVGPEFREQGFDIDQGLEFKEGVPQAAGMGASPYYGVGDTVIGLWYDDVTGLYLDYYTVVYSGPDCEVWLNQYLWFPDPAHPGNDLLEITQEQIDYLAEEFELNIRPKTTEYFGEPNEHTGDHAVLDDILGLPSDYYYDPDGRDIIMISNIGDEHYWDPTYPSFIIGFYWGLYEQYFDRNIINLDAYAWEVLMDLEEGSSFAYESTTAHEYQHLIHADLVPGDETFINEGFSLFSEFLCGYGIDWGKVETYLATPDNSLVTWGDQGGINILADYGAALLFAMYLNDQFGDTFIATFMENGVPGLPGLEALLPKSFAEVYHDWRIANLLHSDKPGQGIYNYNSFDLADAEEPLRIYEVTPSDVPLSGLDFGTTITGYGNNGLGFDTGIAELPAYGSDYIKLVDFRDVGEVRFTFDGTPDSVKISDDWVIVDASAISYYGTDYDPDLEWYSTDMGPLNDMSIFSELTLPTGLVTLTFDTYMDIEDYWDFAFVQISTDGGDTWTSLENEYTTSDHAGTTGAIQAQLPGLTGWSGGWMNMEFDLSAYAGQTVQLRFRYMTDWGTQYEGWYVDNIAINGFVVDNTDDIVSFAPLEVYSDIDFYVTLIKVHEKKNGDVKYNKIKTLVLDDETEFTDKMIEGWVAGASYVYLIISPVSTPISNVYCDYTFDVFDHNG
jgi:hypothetical protein